MKKFAKIAGVVAAVLVVLLVVLLVLAKIFVTPERIKAAVVPMAEEALQRPVSLGEIEVSLFSGITLHDLAVGQREGEGSFVATDKAVLRYQLLPLLFKRVVIDEARLEAPRIRAERLPDGRFNFSDLLEGPEKAGTEAKAERETAPPPVDLLVTEVVLNDGEVLFQDRAMNREAPLQYRISNLNFRARNISLENSFPLSLSARLEEAEMKVDGQIDPAALTGKFDLSLKGVDVPLYAPYFQKNVPGTLKSLTLDLDLQVEGGAEKIDSSGQVGIRDLDLVLEALPESPLKGDASLDYQVTANLEESTLRFGESQVRYREIPVRFQGAVTGFDSNPAVEMTVTLPELDLAKALQAAPEKLATDLGDLDPAGALSLEASLAGPVADPKRLLQKGEVKFTGVQATAGGLRPEINGVLQVQGDRLVSQGLFLMAGGNRADVDLEATNLMGKPVSVTSRISAERFALDPILVSSTAAAAGQVDQKPSTGGDEEIGPLDLPLKVRGSVHIGQTVYKGLAVDDFVLEYRLQDNVLTVDTLTGKLAGGRFNNTGRVNLAVKGLDYRLQTEVAGVRADPFLSALVPKASGTVFGTLNLDGRFTGRGTRSEAIRKNLSGEGKFLLAEGKVTGAGLVQGLAGYLDLEELRVLRFSKAQGGFQVENGKVRIDSDFSGSDVRMAPQGTVGLDGRLDLALNTRLSPDLAGKLDAGGKVAGLLKDQQGWSQVPLKVSGTMSSPRFALDTGAVQERVKEKAREEIQKKLQEKVLDELAPKEGGEAEEPAQKKLEETLRGLFGN